MLNGDAPAEGFNALQVPVGNGLAMVKKPVQSCEWHLAVNFLKYI
jgi:hypothetical protein